MNEHVAAEMLRGLLRKACAECYTCTAEEADGVPVQALIAFMRGETTAPWGGAENLAGGHLSETMREVVRAVLEEREACAELLDQYAAAEQEGERVATSDSHRTIARTMGKAFRSGAAAIRARK
jgi:hypothetical protein